MSLGGRALDMVYLKHGGSKMLALKAHYNDGILAFDGQPPLIESNVIVTFLDGNIDPVDKMAAERLDMPVAHYSDLAVRGSKAVRPIAIDDDDGWE
jgi:hypothetical protein